ncbi:MAG: hypothetical protein IPP46_10790 [Bacteroidetes bacterium]|nr:hypothetical protein [Bacteroidota bacterium]
MKASISNMLNTGAGSCPDADALWLYTREKLPHAELRVIEDHLVGCDLCAAAVEGFAGMERPDALKEIAAARPVAVKTNFSSLWTLSIVLVVLFFIGWWGSTLVDKKEAGDMEKGAAAPSNDLVVDSVGAMPDSVVLQVESNEIDSLATGEKEPKKIPEQSQRWTEELFAIEKRNIQPANFNKPEYRVSGRPEVPIIYMNNLKVMDFSGKYAVAGQIFEVPQNLHPRFANAKDSGQESLQADQDTVFYRELLRSALLAFGRDDFNQTIEQLSIILQKYPEDDNALFYSAFSLAQQGNLNKAIGLFKRLTVKKHSAFIEEASFHLAETYRQNGNVKESEVLFKRIAAGEGFYAGQAKLKLAE